MIERSKARSLRSRYLMVGGGAVVSVVGMLSPSAVASAAEPGSGSKSESDHSAADTEKLAAELTLWMEGVEAGFTGKGVDIAEPDLSRSAIRAASVANGQRVDRAAAIAESQIAVVSTKVEYAKLLASDEEAGTHRFDVRVARQLSNGVLWQAILPVIVREAGGRIAAVRELELSDFPATTEDGFEDPTLGLSDPAELSGPEDRSAFADPEQEQPSSVQHVSDEAPIGASPAGGVAAAANVPPAGLMPNTQGALDYLVQWWDGFNPAYDQFGNDCTNFISQATRAGGWGYEWGWSSTRWQDISNDQSWFSSNNSPWWPAANRASSTGHRDSSIVAVVGG